MSRLVSALTKVGGNTGLSRILGFIRDLVFARLFGADAHTDAFFVAFKIPNLFRRLFAEGAFAAAFVPVLSEYKETRSFDDLKSFIDHVAGTLGLFLLLISLLGVLGAPLLIAVVAPGWYFGETGEAQLAGDMLRLTFPYLLFISLTAFAGGILNTHGQFGIPAFTPVLLNLCLIAAAYFLTPFFDPPIMGLAWGVLIAGIAQFAFQLPFLHRLRLLPKFKPSKKEEGVLKVLRLMGPAVFGASATQIGLLLNTLIASLLVEGSISWLYYSDRLMEFPVGILGAALATVILPSLSRTHNSSTPAEFSRLLDWGLRWSILLGLPAAVGLFVMAGPLISTLFQSTVFDSHDVMMSRLSLMAYGFGLLPFLLVKVFAPGFYARQDTKTPVRFAIIAILVNVSVSLILFSPMGHVGLALATTISATVNASLLYLRLRSLDIYMPPAGWRMLLFKTVTASFVMGLLLWWQLPMLETWLQAAQGWKVWQLLLWIVTGVLVYFGVLLALGVRKGDFSGKAA
ncbi:murein biosynthesis integral membrane protein MurJ [Solemya velum gill symbiont]|uniref:murein biosynthesis integral membrane protein MurJ n=1 Tax=Solemya velum gill symbiont TaxID=2340 RepID=UPI000996DA1F|nr:murein biosynthesis integral membrane protein MurJ [Solemya velum gill symbiont]OOZ77821.1 murein biosynthesis integral membrane protein MurJ [Solemya velum gill symbiont]